MTDRRGHRKDDRRGGPPGGTRGSRDGASRRSGRPPQDAVERPAPQRRQFAGDGELPRWVQEEVSLVTAKPRIGKTLEVLQAAAKAFADGRHGKARHLLEEAKELSPRTATIRELLALSCYRLGQWEPALRELRTFRRLTGESTHLPVEMDVLRALDRPADVEAAWQSLRRLKPDRDTEREGRVVYGSFLLDAGRDREAWEVTNPRRIGNAPEAGELRVWFVAARAAARLGDQRTARRLFEAIQAADPAMPGLDELDRATAG